MGFPRPSHVLAFCFVLFCLNKLCSGSHFFVNMIKWLAVEPVPDPFPHLSCFKILWTVSYEWLQWLLILIAMLISGSVLVITFWPAVRDDTRMTAFSVMAAIVLLHALLAIGCKVVCSFIGNYSYNIQDYLHWFKVMNYNNNLWNLGMKIRLENDQSEVLGLYILSVPSNVLL